MSYKFIMSGGAEHLSPIFAASDSVSVRIATNGDNK